MKVSETNTHRIPVRPCAYPSTQQPQLCYNWTVA